MEKEDVQHFNASERRGTIKDEEQLFLVQFFHRFKVETLLDEGRFVKVCKAGEYVREFFCSNFLGFQGFCTSAKVEEPYEMEDIIEQRV